MSKNQHLHPFIARWYHHCPQCKTELNQQQLMARCPACEFTFYINPAPCTSILVEKDDRLLLAKRAVEPNRGWWDTLGGFVSVDETIAEGALREIKEETSLTVSSLTQLGPAVPDVYGNTDLPTLNFIFLTRTKNKQAIAKDDVAELHWFSIDEMPYDQLAFNSARVAIDRYKQYNKERYV